MFSKALYKQSWKANWISWVAVSLVMSFILVIIMGMSGGSGVGNIASSFTDTLISASIEGNFQKSSLNYYYVTTESFADLDQKVIDKVVVIAQNSTPADVMSNLEAEVPGAIQSAVFEMISEVSVKNEELYGELKDNEETSAQFEQYSLLTTAALTFSFDSSLVKDSIGDLYALHENNNVPPAYDFAAISAHVNPSDLITIVSGGEVPITIYDYIRSSERDTYRKERALKALEVFLAGTMSSESAINTMLESFQGIGLAMNREKYDSFGFDYETIKDIAAKASVTYQARLDLEVASLENPTTEELKLLKANLRKDITASIIEKLPSDLQDTFEDMKDQDMYTMIVGNIYFKVIGLLFSIVFVILVGLNLIAGQVDSGSMAYILSTGTKRDTVTFTQSVFFITSTILLYIVSSIVSVIVFYLSPPTFSPVTMGTMLLFNLGGLMVTLTLGAIMFMASAIFNRSKHAMALGGGVAVLTLVFTILGIFGSDAVPKMMRMNSLRFFNYLSLATLIDFNSMIAGTTDYLWKLGILAAVSVVSYVIGIAVFRKKDLPL